MERREPLWYLPIRVRDYIYDHKLKRALGRMSRRVCRRRGHIRLHRRRGAEHSSLGGVRGQCPDGADDCGAWIAVSDKASEGNWVCTVDGSTQSYQPWSSIGGEPNGGSGENCANMWGPNSGRNDGAWNDYGCTGARMPCICRGGGGGSSEDLFVAGPSGGNYYDATAYCSSIGASIATIYSATENELARQACGGSSCWIGLEEVGGDASTPKESQTWQWVDGSEVTYACNIASVGSRQLVLSDFNPDGAELRFRAQDVNDGRSLEGWSLYDFEGNVVA